MNTIDIKQYFINNARLKNHRQITCDIQDIVIFHKNDIGGREYYLNIKTNESYFTINN